MAETIFRERVSTVVIEKKKLLAFNAIDPNSQKHYVFLPGGAIEKNESFENAAIRETLEETGFKVKIISPPLSVDYPFFWNGTNYSCRTHFFKGRIVSKGNSALSEPDYHQGICWVDIASIEEEFSYSIEILNAIKSLL